MRSDSFYGGRPIIARGPIPVRQPRFEGGVTVDIGSANAGAFEVRKGAQISVGGLPTPPASPDAASSTSGFEFKIEVPEVKVTSAPDVDLEVEEKVPGSFEVTVPVAKQLAFIPTPPPTPPLENVLVLPRRERRERKPLSIVVSRTHADAVQLKAERRIRGKENAAERC